MARRKKRTATYGGGHWVYTPYIRKGGKLIRPKCARVFRIWVRD